MQSGTTQVYTQIHIQQTLSYTQIHSCTHPRAHAPARSHMRACRRLQASMQRYIVVCTHDTRMYVTSKLVTVQEISCHVSTHASIHTTHHTESQQEACEGMKRAGEWCPQKKHGKRLGRAAPTARNERVVFGVGAAWLPMVQPLPRANLLCSPKCRNLNKIKNSNLNNPY